jgi:hypothetical protein
VAGSSTVAGSSSVWGDSTVSGNSRVLSDSTVQGNLNAGADINVWGTINLGMGFSKPDAAAGTISYQRYTTGLDIVGAGTSINARRVTLHAQGGTTIQGGTTMNGAVGIGASPTYTLDVVGGNNFNFNGVNVLLCARFGGPILSGGFLQSSDRRIKDVVGESDASRDMEHLRKIRITDYRMKDRNPNDQRVIKGVIAQELREALPDAVAEIPNIIPSAPVEAASVERAPGVAPVVAKFAAPHGIQKGERIRLEIDGRTQDVNVTEVVDDRTLAFEGGIEAPKTVRVVGREVKDFLNVDYQQVYMTAVSALQEVDRRLQAVDQRVQEVEKREARVAELEKKAARVENLERDVAELRKLMAAIQSGAGKGATSASAGGSSACAVALSR